ncbi:MAG: hypothetical protein IPJ88_14890 [Myxococcales bacterium]|nr:MAG: hypothetical protein IPJ88_14890 [Myxococcales bacterium]
MESGLNCGGHAFATEGHLLGPILREFQEKRQEFDALFEPFIQSYCEKKNWLYQARDPQDRIRLTVQGGIGNAAEVARLVESFGFDATGWASPFLLVPEATALDDATREKLERAGEKELVLSDASPMGVAFNNLRDSSSELWSEKRIAEGTPGSPCPNGHVCFNSEFDGKPLCLGSRQYMKKKLESLGYEQAPARAEANEEIQAIYNKRCICSHLGNGALIALGIAHRNDLPVAICPGPNLAYFDKSYRLEEMVDHIYGRGESLVPQDRPHMFAKELVLYMDHLEKQIDKHLQLDEAIPKSLEVFRQNLEKGIEFYQELATSKVYPGENIKSLETICLLQRKRLSQLFASQSAAARRPAEVTQFSV